MRFSYYFRTRLTADEQRDTEKRKEKEVGKEVDDLVGRDDKNGLWGRVEKIENKLLT